LSSNADSVSDFDGLHVRADFDGTTDDLMSNANWERAFAPSTAVAVISFIPHSSGGQALLDRMNITATDAAALDGNVNVAVFKGLELEFLLCELRPFLLVIDHEALGGLWVRHCGGLGSSFSVEIPLCSEICRLNKRFNGGTKGKRSTKESSREEKMEVRATENLKTERELEWKRT